MRQAKQDWRDHHRVKAITGFVSRHWPSIALILSVLVFAAVTVQTRSVSEAIQENREELIRTGCEEQNARNHNTIATLDALLEQAKDENPERARRIEESRDFTVLLINALVPVRDCDEVVRTAELST